MDNFKQVPISYLGKIVVHAPKLHTPPQHKNWQDANRAEKEKKNEKYSKQQAHKEFNMDTSTTK